MAIAGKGRRKLGGIMPHLHNKREEKTTNSDTENNAARSAVGLRGCRFQRPLLNVQRSLSFKLDRLFHSVHGRNDIDFHKLQINPGLSDSVIDIASVLSEPEIDIALRSDLSDSIYIIELLNGG